MIWLSKLEKFYWDDVHPCKWVTDNPFNGGKFGVGIFYSLAPETLASANLLSLKWPRPYQSYETMAKAVSDYPRFVKLANKPYKGGTLGEYSCLVSKSHFLAETSIKV
jgi:hypothetical protein